jgi:hypothetical protein
MSQTVLHVGAHKTGSTLIQRSLLEMRPALRQRGVRVVTHMDDAWDEAGLGDIIPALFADEATPEGTRRLADALRAWSEDAETLLVSSEMLMGPSLVDRRETFYGRAPQSAHMLREAARGDCRVVIHIRDQAGYLDSVYRHKVQNGYAVPFDEWLATVDLDLLSWAPAIEAHRREFGADRVTVLPFRLPETGPATHVLGFLEAAVGITDMDPPDIPDRASNYSLSDIGLEIFRFANTLMSDDDRAEMRPVLRRVFSSATHPSTPLVDEETRRRLENRYGEENAALLS